jgi:GTP cyclohydrolase IA
MPSGEHFRKPGAAKAAVDSRWAAISKRDRLKNPHAILLHDLQERANNCCESCEISNAEALEKYGRRLGMHHLNYDRTVPLLSDVELLCAHCHGLEHGDNARREDRFPFVAKAVGNLLKTLGVDLADENFVETPRRFATYLMEHFYLDAEQDLEEWKNSVFPSEYEGMVIQGNIKADGMCPHHLLPIDYTIAVGYIPQEDALGLSKLARIAKSCAQAPKLQEDITLEIAVTLEDVLQTQNVAVLVQGVHSCMAIRGIKAHESSTSTSVFKGDFYSDLNTRNEFLTLLGHAKERR